MRGSASKNRFAGLKWILLTCGVLCTPIISAQQPNSPSSPQPPVAGASNPAAAGVAPAPVATSPTPAPGAQPMTAQAQAVAPKFQLTPEQEAYLDKVLTAWELHSAQIQTFQCKITRWEYNQIHQDPANPSKASAIRQGEIRFAMPDQGYYRIDEKSLEGASSPEQMICDGKSLFMYDYASKKIREMPLPPEYQGRGITQCPVLPFLFGARKDDLKRRFLMQVKPTSSEQDIVIEAYPRLPDEAAQYRFVQIMLNIQKNGTILPTGLRIWLPGGQIIHTYRLTDLEINRTSLPEFITGNPFAPKVPMGWELISADTSAAPVSEANTRPLAGSPEAVAEGVRTH